ncbi:MAG: response regulator [Candidatus Acidiferrales bacterium]
MKSLRILIADDHDLIRRGVKSLLELHNGWKVCAEASKGPEAVEKTEQLKPDVVIIDVCMPELNGVEATRQIRKASPRTEVLVLSVHHSEHLIREILDAGARAFVVKTDCDNDLVRAVEALGEHKPFFNAYATEMLLGGYGLEKPLATTPQSFLGERLTPREREIVQLLAEGRTSKEIATLLRISSKTAETHRANIMRKLQFHSVGEVVRYAVRNQIIDP